MNTKKLVNVFCGAHCSDGTCEFQAEVEDGKIIHLEIHPKMKYPPCAKGWTTAFYSHPEALQYPLKRMGKRGEGKWQRISWDEALDTIVGELNNAKSKYGNNAIAWYTAWLTYLEWEMPSGPKWLLYKLFNLWGGCLQVSSRSNSTLAGATSKAMKYIFGGTDTCLPESKECKLIIIWGLNPAETMLKAKMNSYLEAKEKGTKFIFFDPIYTNTASMLADEHIPVHPGTDGALALAMTNIIMQEELHDKDFITNYTNAPFLVLKSSGLLLQENHVIPGGSQDYMVWDPISQRPQSVNKLEGKPPLSGSYIWKGFEIQSVWQILSNMVKEWTPERAANITGVPAEIIVRLSKEFALTKPARIDSARGGSLGFHTGAENTAIAIQLLNVITGNIHGFLNITGHADQPLSGYDIGLMDTARKLWKSSNPVLTPFPVSQFAEAILNPSKYNTNIKALFCMYANPVAQIGNSNKTVSALLKLDFIAVADTFMSATARYADILLPSCLAWAKSSILESSDIGNPMRYTLFIRMDPDFKPQKQLYFSEKAVEPMGESKDDFEIVCALGRKMGYGEYFPWKNVEEYIEEILYKAKENPAYPWLKQATIERLKNEGIINLDIPSYMSPMMRFPTPSGRIELYSERLLVEGFDPLPIFKAPEEGLIKTPELYRKYPLNLITTHSLWRCHNNFNNQPELLEQYSHDVLINPLDASKRDIKDGDAVIVFNDRGSLELKANVSETIKPGVVRIYHCGSPELGMENLLTSDRLTGHANSPAYNTCLVEVVKKENTKNS